MSTTAASVSPRYEPQQKTAYRILFIIGLCHLLNDSIQSVIPAMFPILEKSMGLSYSQLGMIAFSLNIVSSIMQPAVGMATDKKPFPFALPIGLTSTLFGILGLAFAPDYKWIIISVLFIGLGSAVFHPEGSRVAYMAAWPAQGSGSIYLSSRRKHRTGTCSYHYRAHSCSARSNGSCLVYCSCCYCSRTADLYSIVVYWTPSGGTDCRQS